MGTVCVPEAARRVSHYDRLIGELFGSVDHDLSGHDVNDPLYSPTTLQKRALQQAPAGAPAALRL
jgi:hypothetical protein